MTEITDSSDASSAPCRSQSLREAATRPDPTPPTAASEDIRFRQLLGPAWIRLPAAVRARFSKPLATGELRLFAGEVVETRLSPLGRCLARLARLIGGPLPDTDGATGPASVLVAEDERLGGQIWTRTYSRPGRLPQTISSVKRFRGPTGLEEHLGRGLVMRLTLDVVGESLVFRSTGFALEAMGLRLTLPGWLSPGTCTITHRALGPSRFSFTLALDHSRFGPLVHQTAVFEEIAM